jgi:hypothetical protein
MHKEEKPQMSSRSFIRPATERTACAVCLTGLLWFQSISPAAAQEMPASQPSLVTFWGAATGLDGKPRTGIAGVTFSIYKDRQGGAPLWMETQNVALDANGGYTAQIGATLAEGLPIGLFSKGEARWLEVQVESQAPAARVLLVSVPYALKAVDAQTLGGLPASAYALAGTSVGAAAGGSAMKSTAPLAARNASDTPPPAADITGSGTAGYLPVFSGASTIADSVVQQKSGAVGIGTAPATAKLTVANSAGDAMNAGSSSTSGAGVQAQATAATGTTYGVFGRSASSTGTGVAGQATSTSGITTGVVGISNSTSGAGVSGTATATTGSTYGVYANDASSTGYAVYGTNTATSGAAVGLYGTSASTTGFAVDGANTATSGQNAGVYGTTASPGGAGVWANNSATTGYGYGLYAASNAATRGVGIYGTATSASGEGYGVIGFISSASGIGVSGYGPTISTIGSALQGSAGVWGDTSSGSVGVLATASSHEALAAYNSATNVATMFVENQEDTNNSATVFATYSDYGGYCDIFVNGNLTCSGSVGGHASINQSRDVALYSVQAADNWMEDAGSGQLRDGVAVVKLDADYAQTVNTSMDYHVFLTPNGDCKGLYVTQKSPASFEVHELGGGVSNIAFDYRIMARRKGFESTRLADITGKIQVDTRLGKASARNPPPPTGVLTAPAAVRGTGAAISR